MKLKTLKDLNAKLITTDNLDREWISKPELKAEAVKWVKIGRAWSEYPFAREINEEFGTNLTDGQCAACSMAVVPFINFFNFTEEDLKTHKLDDVEVSQEDYEHELEECA